MRICYFGTYRADYPRNKNMIEGLRIHGVEVVECHENLWHGIEDRVQAASGGWKNPKFIWRVLGVYYRLIKRYLKVQYYDCLVVGYPGQFDVILGWFLTRINRKPLVWDILMSIYLVSIERKLDRINPFTIRFLKLVEYIASRLPDRMILEGDEYIAWFCDLYRIPKEKFYPIPLGIDEKFFTLLETCPVNPDVFSVVYYGSFIRNHGVDKIIEAAKLLAHDPTIQFTLIGTGPECESNRKRAIEYGLQNVTFSGWLDQKEFNHSLSAADLCLGVFGDTPQSYMTIQHKIYECLAMRKPLVTGKAPAVGRAFAHGIHLFLCDRTPASLADAIVTLKKDPEMRQSLANAGHDLVISNYSLSKTGQRFRDLLLMMVTGGSNNALINGAG